MRKNRISIIYILLAAYTFLLSGCGSRQVFVEEPVVSPTVPAFSPTLPVDREVKLIDVGPVQGGTLTLSTTPIDSLNPFNTVNRYVSYISLFIYESLFIQTSENEIETWLIDDWSSENYTVWNFTLKDDVLFHNDRELTSYDVRYTMRELEKSNSPFYDNDIIDNIKEFNIISSTQFEIQLKEPDRTFVKKLTFPIFSQNNEDEGIIGTGPYCFDTMDENQIKLVRNDGWWRGMPYINNIVFDIYGENEMLDAFQNNEVDVAFIKNVDFSKYEYRTDMDYRVYPGSECNFLYVNPNSIFGQYNRQNALFNYVTYRLYDLNIGQVQYFDEYSQNPIGIDEFKNELIKSGLVWNEVKKLFTYQGKTLKKISVVVPKQDIQKLHTANFLVNILGDVGISAEIITIDKNSFNNGIRNGTYDLSPVTEELRPWESLADTLQRIQEDLGYGREKSFILPLYRKQQAILFKNNIRGEKNSNYWNPYHGFYSWYMPVVTEDGLED